MGLSRSNKIPGVSEQLSQVCQQQDITANSQLAPAKNVRHCPSSGTHAKKKKILSGPFLAHMSLIDRRENTLPKKEQQFKENVFWQARFTIQQILYCEI